MREYGVGSLASTACVMALRYCRANAKPADKQYTMADGQGLSVLVRPNGTKLWLYRYRFGSKRKNLSFGTFPRVGLKAAREKRHDAESNNRDGAQSLLVGDAN